MTQRSGHSLVTTCLLAMAACLSWSPTPLARSVTDLVHFQLEEVTTDVTPLHSDTYAATGLAAVDGHANLGRPGRQLTVFPAVAALASLATSVLDAFVGIAVGEATDAIFGSQVVPVDLAELINDALEEIDRIVGDKISEAFNNFQQTQLNSLALQVREYTRRNNLEVSRGQVQDMLGDASNLLAFFEENGVVTNSAFQTTLGLRLSLLLELLQLDQLIGESDATLAVAEGNIRAQARAGRLALEEWASSFKPVTNTISVRRTRPCASFLPSGVCRDLSTRRTDLKVCMNLGSRGLESPKEFCKRKSCTSKHVFGGVRRKRINRCLDAAERPFRQDVLAHARTTGIQQFRSRNEKAVFGEAFRPFLAKLKEAEKTEFVDASASNNGPDLPSDPILE